MHKWALMCALILAPTITSAAPDGGKAAADPSAADPAAGKTPAAKTTLPAAAPAAAPAAPAASPKKAAPAKKPEAAGLMKMMDDGGPMMWVIFFVSLCGLIIFLERGNTLYLAMRLDFKGFMSPISKAADGKDYRAALKTTSAYSKCKHPVVGVATIALTKAGTQRSRKDIETAMEDKMLAALPNLNKRIGLLSFLANSSTLLGLLGTIFGLIAAFAAFGDPNVPAALKQAKLTDGISQAMYTTAAGIVAAVPLLFFHHLLSERQEEVMNEMEAGATKLMTTFESNDLFTDGTTEA